MLGSVGSVVPKRWILGIFALGLIAVMVATSANPWAGASSLPTVVSASALSPTSIQVSWTAADASSTLPESGAIVDGYRVDCVPTSGTTATVSVTGRTTATATLSTNVVANTAYVCSVFSSSNSTLPSTGVAAASITTPASLAAQLGSVVVSPASANVQVGDGITLSATSKGADTGKTAITGLTVNWTVTSNGSVSASTGDIITYSADTAGSATVTASVTQSSTGITKTVDVTVTNFSPPVSAPPPAPVDPPAADIPATPDISDAPGGTAAAAVLTSTSASATLAVTGTSGSASVAFPANAVPSGTAAAVRTDLTEVAGTTASLPSGVSGVGSALLTVALTDNTGAAFTTRLQNAATVRVSVPLTTVTGAGADVQGLTIYKATNPDTGPWNKLTTNTKIVGSNVEASADVLDFSSFRLGFETRDVSAPGAGGGAVLPSAGDVAPTATQALLVTGLGLLLIVGGGVYVRRQRRATGTD